jgi:hypothetical protein
MKAKLIKTDVNYLLEDDKGVVIGSTSTKENNKLSKQNCDEIFGVIDVEELAYQSTEEVLPHHGDYRFKNVYEEYFKEGFNKAMELNKDKVFTLEDMGNLWDFCTYNKGTFAEFIQQLTEIEVEIETERIPDGLDESCHIQYAKVPKLDENGCLILTKK